MNASNMHTAHHCSFKHGSLQPERREYHDKSPHFVEHRQNYLHFPRSFVLQNIQMFSQSEGVF